MKILKLAGTIPTLALAVSISATASEASTTGFINSDRFGYSGTVTRHDSLDDAKNATKKTDTIEIGDRDLSLFIRNGLGSGDWNVIMGSWWYTTDDQGRAGWGNTRGNTGEGYMQIYDSGGVTDTNVDMSFSNFDGTYYQDFNLSLTGQSAGADQFARLSVFDNVNDGGTFHEYALNLTASGLQGTVNGGFIEALDTQPTGVMGSIRGVFELTENQTSSANIGFYNFDFDLSMTNWAWENRNDLMTQDADGNPIPDSFTKSNFIAPVPLPAAGWLLLTAFGGLGLAARRRRKAA